MLKMNVPFRDGWNDGFAACDFASSVSPKAEVLNTLCFYVFLGAHIL